MTLQLIEALFEGRKQTGKAAVGYLYATRKYSARQSQVQGNEKYYSLRQRI
jgi:hypothetical protein